MPVGYRVYTSIPRPASALIERLSRLKTPDLSDGMRRAGTMDNGIRPVTLPPKGIAGPAVTVSVPNGAFNIVKAGMQQTQRGDVLVINARGALRGALVGGNVCRGLMNRGSAGVVADGAIRDAEEISEVGSRVPPFRWRDVP